VLRLAENTATDAGTLHETEERMIGLKLFVPEEKIKPPF